MTEGVQTPHGRMRQPREGDKLSRTIREMSLSTGVAPTRDLVLRWLDRNGFEILEQNSAGQTIRKSFRSFKVTLATRPGSIVALRAKWTGMTVFEIRLEPKEPGCLVHGEFYVAGAGGGTVDYEGREMDVCEKPDMVGSFPRKKGFRLMNQFISDLEAGTSG